MTYQLCSLKCIRKNIGRIIVFLPISRHLEMLTKLRNEVTTEAEFFKDVIWNHSA